MEIVRKAAFKVVGLRVRAAADQRWIEMPNAWKTFIGRSAAIPWRIGETFIDVTLGKHDGVAEELLSAEVSQFDTAPEDMTKLEIPAATYLHHRHAGPLHAIATAYGDMVAWARANGCTLDEFKLDFGYTSDGSESAHELYVKIL